MMTKQEAKELLQIPLKNMTEEQKKKLKKAIKILSNAWGDVNGNQ